MQPCGFKSHFPYLLLLNFDTMCLERSLKDNPLKIADVDIVCYKGVQVPYEKWFKFKTWWMRKLKRFKDYQTYFTADSITLGEIFIARPVLSEEDLHIFDRNKDFIEGGFIHSFKNKKDAIEFAKHRSHVDVVKCIIPAGTYYFEGLNNGDTPGYVSTQIKYVKVIY